MQFRNPEQLVFYSTNTRSFGNNDGDHEAHRALQLSVTDTARRKKFRGHLVG